MELSCTCLLKFFQTKQYASASPKSAHLLGGWTIPVSDVGLFCHVTDAGLILIGGQKPGKTTWQIMAYHIKVCINCYDKNLPPNRIDDRLLLNINNKI